MRRPILTSALLRRARILDATDRTIQEKARNLVWRGRCSVEESTPMLARVLVNVGPHEQAKVRMDVLQDGSISCDCDCPFFTGAVPCLHIAAAALSLEQHLSYHPPHTWETRLEATLTGESAVARTKKANRWLAFSLQPSYRGQQILPYAIPRTALEGLSLGATAAELVPLLKAQSGRGWRLRTIESAQFDNASEEALLAARVAAAQSSFYYSNSGEGSVLNTLLALLPDALVFQGTEDQPFRSALQVLPGAGTIQLELVTEDDGGLSLSPVVSINQEPAPAGKREVLVNDPLWLRLGDKVVGFGEVPRTVTTLLDSEPISVPTEEVLYFRTEYLPRMAERLPLTGEGIFGEEIAGFPPVPRLYLGEREGELVGQLAFGYGEGEVPYRKDMPIATLRPHPESGLLQRVHRNPTSEQVAYELLTHHGLKRGTEEAEFQLRARLTPVDFLLHHVPRLAEGGFTIFGEDSLKGVKVNRVTPTLSFNVSSGIDWFDVEAIAEFGDTTASLKELRRAIKKRERYVKLADGSIGMIPEEWIQRFRHVFALAGESSSGEALRLSPLHALLFEQALTDSDGDARQELEFQKKKSGLRSFEKLEPTPVPEGFTGTLRAYQKAGYDWLHFLRQHGFGGCLADDMGVGKTPQALALLLSVQGNSPHASLLVLPRSLVFNWEREAEKFTPSLKLLRYDDASRTTDTASFDGYDLIVTTYGILLRDIEKLSKYPFHYAILDEAQAIKNPLAQTSRAARLLKAEHRLTLTGTPIENGTIELWSQFAFLNPGLFGGLESFKENFLGPIEKQNDASSVAALRTLTHPFLLRRTKAQVASDLPPRTERAITVEMDKAQRKLYDQTRDRYRAQILGIYDEAGSAKAQMTVLEGLLRLRQICCDPRLVDPESKAGSAKREALLETMQTLRAEGHKALIFSQFVQMLSLLKKDLDQLSIPYLYLDGRTKDRQGCVDQFQNNTEIPFFLISLKAGGVGLNLTAADYVLHIDPWWNPAVEAQASDRTHRIGQEKPVFVYKFLARDSVEEKILLLQERKKTLVDSLIQTEQSLFKSLSRDDITALFS